MASSTHADVIIIGAGTMGTAAAWALARRGVEVIAIDQFAHLNSMASHGGHTRIFRHCYFEGERYVPWALESDHLFAALQDRTGLDLQIRVGCLDIGTPENGHARKSRAAAEAHNLPFETLSAQEVNERFPAWNLPDNYEANLDPEGGVLRVENIFRAFRNELEIYGGVIVENTPVTGWSATDTGVEVHTADATYTGKHLIVTAGAWAGKMLKDLNLPVKATRKPVIWYETDTIAPYRPEQFPPFIIDVDVDVFYGLPAVSSDGVKMGNHSDMHEIDPDNFDREHRPGDITNEFSNFVTTMLNGAHPRAINTSMCMYTMTPDEDFIIDRHLQHGNVSIAAGFSGHGFKFAPKVGEHLADLAINESAEAIPMFSINRFG